MLIGGLGGWAGLLAGSGKKGVGGMRRALLIGGLCEKGGGTSGQKWAGTFAEGRKMGLHAGVGGA